MSRKPILHPVYTYIPKIQKKNVKNATIVYTYSILR
jgi:hypothetical protein